MKTRHFLLLFFMFFSAYIYSQFNADNIISSDKGKISFVPTLNQTNHQSLKPTNVLKSETIDWSTEDVNISNNPTVDTWDARIDVGQDGSLYVVYNDNHLATGLQKIMFTKKEPGSNWSAPIYIDAGGIIGNQNNHFPAVCVSPNGDIHAIFNVWANENIRNYIGYSYYNASTGEWDEAVKISDLGGTVNHFWGHHDIYSTQNNLPVVIWGFDNRENEDVEEVYMKYHDGAQWSNDIIVSTPNDSLNAFFPYLISIGNNKAMIMFAENTTATDTLELRYRIYDENTHELGEIKSIPNTSHDIHFMLQYTIANRNDGNVMIALWENNYDSNTVKCIRYNIAEDLFIENDHTIVSNSNGNFSKSMSIACDSDGLTSIIYTDTYTNTLNYVEFDEEQGFGEIEVLANEEMPIGDLPEALFDSDGNVHLVWQDLRYDIPGGYLEREIFYKKGTRIEAGFNVNFEIVDEATMVPIEGAEVVFNGIEKFTNSAGVVKFQNIQNGTYTWTVSKLGYSSIEEEAEVISSDLDILVEMQDNSSISKTPDVIGSIFPNPSNGIYSINMPNQDKKIELEVFDVYGKIVKKQLCEHPQSFILDISDQQAGVYYCKINCGEVFQTVKLILNK